MPIRALIKKPSPFIFLFICILILNAFLWWYTYTNFQNAPDLIPMHYTIYFGIDFIDYKIKLFTYPLFGLVILCINSIISFIAKKERLIGYFLLSIALISQIIILATEVALVTFKF